MRFLVITTLNPYGSSKYGGAESSSRLLAEKLADRGHLVMYLTKNVTPEQRDKAAADGVRLAQSFRARKKINSWLLSFSILGKCLVSRTQIIYCFYEAKVLEAALRVKWFMPRIKIVMRMAGMFWYEQSVKNEYRKKRYSHYFSQVDAINFISNDLVSMTEAAMNELNMEGVRFKDSFVLDIGSSASVGRKVPYHSSLSEPFRIIMATRFSDYQKRQDILLRAIALIPHDEQVELLLVGDGVKRAEAERLAKKLEVEDRVTFKPFLSQEELWNTMEQAQLLCHCVDYEGLGKVILESMARGLPPLVSDVRPLNTYIADGNNGYLVENDSTKWAQKIIQLRNSPEQLVTVSENSMRYIQQYYNPDKNIHEYEKYFRAMVV